uniref:Uncharacterized protein n=1 Tax=Anguilla anguilla TaxID=7936 RepID=A0A0E9S9H2_ANGAN
MLRHFSQRKNNVYHYTLKPSLSTLKQQTNSSEIH